MDNDLIYECPHCNCLIITNKNQINCKIFRHGIYKNFVQINPHLSKDKCDYLKDNDKIYGCGKPYELYLENNEWKVRMCDYI